MNNYGSSPFVRVSTAALRPATPPSRAGMFYLESDTGNLFQVVPSGSSFVWSLVAQLSSGIGARVLRARLAAIGNVSIATAPATFDNKAAAAGDVVLLWQQTTAAENGLYVFNGANAAMTRAPGFDETSEVTAGVVVAVETGDAFTGALFQLAYDPANGAIVVGTTALPFRWVQSQRSLADSSGTPGAATINRAAGKSAIALGASSVVITNSLVTATSLIFVTPQGATAADATLTSWRVNPGAGSFTVTGNANATAAWPFSWMVINP